MSNLVNQALQIVAHPILHTPAYQSIGLGTFFGSLGLHWISKIRAHGSTPLSRIQNSALGLLSSGAGIYIFSLGAKRIIDQGFSIYIKEGITPSPRNALHPYETYIANWGASLLHLNKNDSKPKILWLTGSWDYNGALDPKIYSLRMILTKLEKYSDFKYKIIDHPQDICNEIQSAVKIGNLTTLVLNAHGNWGSLHLNEQRNGLSVLQPLPDGCFSNVSNNLKIILMSCATASSIPPLSFAQWLSWTTNKTVYGAKELMAPQFAQLAIQPSGELIVDFCPPSYSLFWSGCSPSESITQVFAPLQTTYEQIIMGGRIGLSVLGGLFVGSQLIRLSLLPLQLTQKLAFRALGKV